MIMKKILLIQVCILSIGYPHAQTQVELNEAEHKKFLKADKELNQIYQQILTEYKTDTLFIKNFKASQKIWIQFRDAELKMMYPDYKDYGSARPMCWSTYKTHLTNERIKKLRLWIEGEEEGDVCSPSIKVKR